MTPTVMNGRKDSLNRYESVVKIRFDKRGAEICSGTLLTPHLVLTAAHCFCGQPTQAEAGDEVVFTPAECKRTVDEVSTRIYDSSSGNLIGEKFSRRISGFMLHPGFRMRFAYYRDDTDRVLKYTVPEARADLAVVHLAEPLQVDKGNGRIDFVAPPEKEDVNVKEEIEVVGYGDINPQILLSGTRYHGLNRVHDHDTRSGTESKHFKQYGKEFFYFKEEFEGQLSDAKETHTLAGDSGGPGFATRTGKDGKKQIWLVGVSSMSSASKSKSSERRVRRSLFTSTFVYQAWINEQKKDSEKRLAAQGSGL